MSNLDQYPQSPDWLVESMKDVYISLESAIEELTDNLTAVKDASAEGLDTTKPYTDAVKALYDLQGVAKRAILTPSDRCMIDEVITGQNKRPYDVIRTAVLHEITRSKAAEILGADLRSMLEWSECERAYADVDACYGETFV